MKIRLFFVLLLSCFFGGCASQTSIVSESFPVSAPASVQSMPQRDRDSQVSRARPNPVLWLALGAGAIALVIEECTWGALRSLYHMVRAALVIRSSNHNLGDTGDHSDAPPHQDQPQNQVDSSVNPDSLPNQNEQPVDQPNRPRQSDNSLQRFIKQAEYLYENPDDHTLHVLLDGALVLVAATPGLSLLYKTGLEEADKKQIGIIEGHPYYVQSDKGMYHYHADGARKFAVYDGEQWKQIQAVADGSNLYTVEAEPDTFLVSYLFEGLWRISPACKHSDHLGIWQANIASANNDYVVQNLFFEYGDFLHPVVNERDGVWKAEDNTFPKRYFFQDADGQSVAVIAIEKEVIVKGWFFSTQEWQLSYFAPQTGYIYNANREKMHLLQSDDPNSLAGFRILHPSGELLSLKLHSAKRHLWQDEGGTFLYLSNADLSVFKEVSQFEAEGGCHYIEYDQRQNQENTIACWKQVDGSLQPVQLPFHVLPDNLQSRLR